MKTSASARKYELEKRRRLPLTTPIDLGTQAATGIAGSMNAILVDVIVLHLKTKHFHRHMNEPTQ
jgi:starvation-inducible DNA-binding protein